MKIFIDFDDVLFNTKIFKSDILEIFLKNGITEDQFRESYWGKTYNLEKQINEIAGKYKIDAEKLRNDMSVFLVDLRKYVFLDVIGFLEFFGKENIFLVSYGHKIFQNQKITNCGLKNNFSGIFITDSSKADSISGELSKNNPGDNSIYFLDDRTDYIEDVKKSNPRVKTILIKRPEGRYYDESNKYCDFVAGNLIEAKNIITK